MPWKTNLTMARYIRPWPKSALPKVDFLMSLMQGRIQPETLDGGAILVIFGRQVSLRVRYCKRAEVYFTTLLWQNNGRQNGLMSRMLFSELYKIVVNKVTFVAFRSPPLDPPLRWWSYNFTQHFKWLNCWCEEKLWSPLPHVMEKSYDSLQQMNTPYRPLSK